MKKICFIAFSLLSLITLALLSTSCDDLSDDPRLDKDFVYFTKDGGTQTVHVKLKKNGKYVFVKLGVRFGDNLRQEKDVDPKDVEIKTLNDGSQKIHYDWVTFLIAKNMKSVKVDVKPNTTGKPRLVRFWGNGKAFGDFYVIQSNTDKIIKMD